MSLPPDGTLGADSVVVPVLGAEYEFSDWVRFGAFFFFFLAAVFLAFLVVFFFLAFLPLLFFFFLRAE